MRNRWRGLVDGGVDILLPETGFDTLNMKACLFAISRVLHQYDVDIPVIVSGTILEGGRTLNGQTADAFWAAVSHYPLLGVGFNCASEVNSFVLTWNRWLIPLMSSSVPTPMRGCLTALEASTTRPRKWPGSSATTWKRGSSILWEGAVARPPNISA